MEGATVQTYFLGRLKNFDFRWTCKLFCWLTFADWIWKNDKHIRSGIVHALPKVVRIVCRTEQARIEDVSQEWSEMQLHLHVFTCIYLFEYTKKWNECSRKRSPSQCGNLSADVPLFCWCFSPYLLLHHFSFTFLFEKANELFRGDLQLNQFSYPKNS